MKTRALLLATIAAALAAACQHEGDGASAGAVTPPSAVAVEPADAGAPPPAIDAALASEPVASSDAGAGADAAAASPSADAPPVVTPPDMSAAPAYPASALYATFSSPASRAKLIACYEPGKQRDPKVRGKVILKFTIQSSGRATAVANEGSNLPDDAVIACVVRTLKTFKFQKPVEGSVTVIYPFIFRNSGDETLILPDAGKK